MSSTSKPTPTFTEMQNAINTDWYYQLQNTVDTNIDKLAHTDWYYALQAQYEQRMHKLERWYAFTRDLPDEPITESHKYEYLVEFFVNEITGPYDQDISFLLVGNKGRGKSLAALSISFYTACELAERLGGKWTDYFNPDTNMAVILEDEANAVMAIQEKYQVKNYDDIGIGWGARNWQNQNNKDKNDVFQINRTDNTLQVFSVPNQFLLDKVPRSLVSHYGEMAQQFFAHGFTTIKIFEPETLFREGKIIQPYLNIDRTKYVLFRVPRPPEDLIAYYKKRRSESKTKATNRRLGGEDEEEQQPDQQRANLKRNSAVLAMENAMLEVVKLYPEIMPVILTGTNTDIVEAFVQTVGMEKKKAQRWVGSPSFRELFPKSK